MPQPSTVNIVLAVLIVLLTYAARRAVIGSHRSAETGRTARFEANNARAERDMLVDRIAHERDAEAATLDKGRESYERLVLRPGAAIEDDRPAVEDDLGRTTFTYDEAGRVSSRHKLMRSELTRATVEVLLDRDKAARIVVSSRRDAATQRDVTTTFYLSGDAELLLAARATTKAEELVEDRWYFLANEYFAYKDRTVPLPGAPAVLDERQSVARFTYPPDTQWDISDLRAELAAALTRLEQHRVSVLAG